MFVVIVQSRSVFEVEVGYADARLALHAAHVEAHFDIQFPFAARSGRGYALW